MKRNSTASSSTHLDASGNPIGVSPYQQPSPLTQPPFNAVYAMNHPPALSLPYQHESYVNPLIPFNTNFHHQHAVSNNNMNDNNNNSNNGAAGPHLNPSPAMTHTFASSSYQTPATFHPSVSASHPMPLNHPYNPAFQHTVSPHQSPSVASPGPSNLVSHPQAGPSTLFVSNGPSMPSSSSNPDVADSVDDTQLDENPSSPSSSSQDIPSPYLPLQELIHSINPDLMEDLKNTAPSILMELMKQDIPPSDAYQVDDTQSQVANEQTPVTAAPINPQLPSSTHHPLGRHQQPPHPNHPNNSPPPPPPIQTNIHPVAFVAPSGANGAARGTAVHMQQKPFVGVRSPQTSVSSVNGESNTSAEASIVAAAAAKAAAAEAAAIAEAASRNGSPRNSARYSSPSRVRSKPKVGEKRTKSRTRNHASSLSTVAAANRTLKKEAQAMAMVPSVTRSPMPGSPGLNVIEQPSPLLNLRGVRISSSSSLVPNQMIMTSQPSTAPNNIPDPTIAAPPPTSTMLVGSSSTADRTMVDGDTGDGGSNGAGPSEKSSDGEEDVEVKKAMRAERNRQSAAASRERKKHHIKELERRVSVLSRENAQLQVDQLQTIHDRLEKERLLLEENKKLKQKVAFRDMEIQKLSLELDKHRIDDAPENPSLKRPKTWDVATFKSKNPLNKLGR